MALASDLTVTAPICYNAEMEKPSNTVFIYVRKSRAGANHKVESIPEQQRELEKMAQRKGLSAVNVFKEKHAPAM